MIRGVVTAEHEAVVHLPVLDLQGQQQSVKVVVDTGYTGWLTLPPNLIANLGLSFNRFGRATLADGSEIAFSIYDAVLIWDGNVIQTRVDAVDTEPLLGMSLMQGYKLIIEDVVGGAVLIELIVRP